MSKWAFTSAHKSLSNTHTHKKNNFPRDTKPKLDLKRQQSNKHEDKLRKIQALNSNPPLSWISLMGRTRIYELHTCCSVEQFMELFI